MDADGNLPSIKELQEPDPEPAPTSSGSQRELDSAATKPLLKEIHTYLLDDDPSAKGFVTELQKLAEGTAAEEQLNRIQEFVSHYEFPEALKLVKELADSLQINLD